MTGEKETRYLAYLLRLWRVDERPPAVWRASLESPHTGERHGFGEMRDLIAFLEQRTLQPRGDDKKER